MSSDLALVLALLCAAILMFALNRPRANAVALIMVVLLPFTGVIRMEEAIAGFANPNIGDLHPRGAAHREPDRAARRSAPDVYYLRGADRRYPDPGRQLVQEAKDKSRLVSLARPVLTRHVLQPTIMAMHATPEHERCASP